MLKGEKMLAEKKLRNKKLIILLLGFGLLLTLFGASKATAATNTSYVHFEFRQGNPVDTSWPQYKYTTSGYYLRSTKIYSTSNYTATPCGKNGGQARVVGRGVTIRSNTTYRLSNYLVEVYGRGNPAWIHAYKNSYGRAYGTWYAD